MATGSSVARNVTERTSADAHRTGVYSARNQRRQTNRRGDGGMASGRGGRGTAGDGAVGGTQRANRRTGGNYGRGGSSFLHAVSSRKDERGHRFRNNVIYDPKDYEHLLIATPDRIDHGGIKFRGEVSECDICCRKSDIFALGRCLHPMCIECGIRLRILCENETCPKCRTVIDTMYFVPFPGEWNDYKLPTEFVEHKDAEKHRIKLADDYIARCYDSYLSHQCLICEKKGEKRVFEKFAQLNQHMYMVHRFEFCDICIENLNLFTRERRFYSHVDLERHLEYGDSDDTSLKGHPQCLFCEKRFLDEEFQYKHLRKEHFFCQICDADAMSNYFFPEYEDLLSHYKAKHIICNEGECLQLGIAFRTDTELKLHKSRDHAAGPQTLNLDFHFSDRNAPPGPSRGGRAGAPSARSALPSQRNIPRISLIPSEQQQRENRPSDANDVTIVPSAQSEQNAPSLRYQQGAQFTLQGSDFPRLGKSARSAEFSNSTVQAQNNKNVKPSATAGAGVKNASNRNEGNAATPSSSWLIDDDEQFPSCRQHSSTLAEQQQTENIEMMEAKAASGITTIESSWSKVMKRPQSLSNVATALAQNGFPSLPAASAPLPVKSTGSNLPVGSVWAKKSHSVMQAPSSYFTASARPSVNTSKKSKQLPVPDLWPQESVPVSWEDISNSSLQESSPKITLKDIVVIKDTSTGKKKETKKGKNKEQSNTYKKANDGQLADIKKEEKLDLKLAPDEFIDPFPSLQSHTQENEVQQPSTVKPMHSFSELLSSAFLTVLDSTTAKDEKNRQSTEATTAESPSKTGPVASSSFRKPNDEKSMRTVLNSIATEQLPPGFGSPPGLRAVDLMSPPGFCPPPGFDNIAVNTPTEPGPEEQMLSVDAATKAMNEDSNSGDVAKALKRGGRKKGKK